MPRHFAIIGSRGYPSTYGGFETFVRKLAPYLVENGDEVSVYCRHGGCGIRTVDGIRCITTRRIETNSASTLSSGLTAAFDARKRGFDAALVLNVANGYFLPILKRAGIPTAVNVDGIEWQRDKWSRLGKAVFKGGAHLTARYADEIIVDSRAIGRIWSAEFGRESTYIPYGADVVDDLDDKRVRELGIEPGSYVLAVARLVPENNIDLLLDAVELLPANLPVVVAGEANKESETSRRLRTLNATRNHFHWLGHVHDQDLLAELWANCLVYFHGHSAGGTNPALLQALGFGAPTLALATQYNREVIDNPEQLVVRDPRTMAHAIGSLREESGTRSTFRARGQQLVRERYTWSTALSRYRSALIGLAERGPRTGVSRTRAVADSQRDSE